MFLNKRTVKRQVVVFHSEAICWLPAGYLVVPGSTRTSKGTSEKAGATAGELRGLLLTAQLGTAGHGAARGGGSQAPGGQRGGKTTSQRGAVRSGPQAGRPEGLRPVRGGDTDWEALPASTLSPDGSRASEGSGLAVT